VKDNEVHDVSGKGTHTLKDLGKELFYSVFWWEGIEHASLIKKGNEYIVRARNKVIHLDTSTLLPKRQEITVKNRKILIRYDKPQIESDYWYPSKVTIEIGAYRFTVRVDRLIINPMLNESDFTVPGEYT
jgi:hypothetical protein